VSPNRALEGRTILTTRAHGQGEELRQGLEALGAVVVHIPTIEFIPPADWTAAEEAIGRLSSYDWIVLTSANAVDTFIDRAGTLPGIRIAAVGQQTARRLGERGVEADLVPEKFRSEALLEQFSSDLTGVRILLPRAEVADETLPETLRSRGATVDVVVVYRTRIPDEGREDLRRLLREDAIDCITLTSGSTVQNLITMLGDQHVSGTAIAAIGPVTRHAAEQAGLQVDIEPESAAVPDLVEAIRRHFEHR
jgi:uroporphyrinogen III methyltransferase/synthase